MFYSAMKYSKFEIKSCCGKLSHMYKFDITTDKSFMQKFIDKGFIESPFLTKSGVLYIENDELILTGTLGGNTLQAKCKRIKCDDIFDSLEKIISELE